jgi:hypothetical protein
MVNRSTMEEKRTGAMKVGAGVLIAFGILALTAGYERQQGAGVNMMLSSPGNMAAGEASGVAARAATVGAKVSTLAKGVEETSQRAATSPETKVKYFRLALLLSHLLYPCLQEGTQHTRHSLGSSVAPSPLSTVPSMEPPSPNTSLRVDPARTSTILTSHCRHLRSRPR